MSDKTHSFLLHLFLSLFAALANLVRLLWDIPICIGSFDSSRMDGGIRLFGIRFALLPGLLEHLQPFPIRLHQILQIFKGKQNRSCPSHRSQCILDIVRFQIDSSASIDNDIRTKT